MGSWQKTFERFMCAATFAEEGDWETARIIIDSDKKKFQETRDAKRKMNASRPRVRV